MLVTYNKFKSHKADRTYFYCTVLLSFQVSIDNKLK